MPGYHWLPASLQRHLLDREGRRDATRLSRDVDGLADRLAEVRGGDAELDDAYRAFVHLPEADPVMAASLDLAGFLLAWCRCRHPGRIADLGSGFTSWLFRRWAREHGADVEVVSVDDDPAWLERSREFVADRGLEPGGFVGWPGFRADGRAFDLVLWDYGDVRTRAECMEEILGRVAAGGALVCDDVHKRRIARAAAALGRRRPVVSYSLRAYTLDRWGRYAWLARPGAGGA